MHAVDLGSIGDAVAQMAADCGKHLSLVIMTHRHADHISGFAKCSDVFSKITVDRVWMPWFENPDEQGRRQVYRPTSRRWRASFRCGWRRAASGPQLAAMVENITGGMAAAADRANQKALDVLHGGFKNKVKPDYYKAGDPAKLPQDLVDVGLSAQILGPPGDPALITQMTNTADQYLADAMQDDDGTAKTFPKAFPARYAIPITPSSSSAPTRSRR